MCRAGRIRELISGGYPVMLLTHWQSLYTQGTGLGLEGLQTLMERIQKVFGNTFEWVTCSERAKRLVERQSTDALPPFRPQARFGMMVEKDQTSHELGRPPSPAWRTQDSSLEEILNMGRNLP
jgi:hypothetical protein